MEGCKRLLDSSLSNLAVYSNGHKRFAVGNLALTTEGANTAAVLHGLGTSTTPAKIGTADKNFIGYWMENSATSGSNRGVYLRFYLSGAAGSGECLRVFTTVKDVAAGTAHGAHLTLNFASSGSITGLGVASRNTLHVANAAAPANGTYAATQPEIYSDGSASDPTAVAELSFIRCVNGGDATGVGLVDDKAFFVVFSGGAAGSGNMIGAAGNEPTWTAHTFKIRCKAPDGTTLSLLAVDN